MRSFLSGTMFFILCAAASAQTPPPAQAVPVPEQAAPLLEPKPVFIPGQYETESRNSRFPKQPAKASVCFDSQDFESFRRETMRQYLESKRLSAVCRLSDDKRTPKGFAFAMDCGRTKVIASIEFEKDFVRDHTRTIIQGAPQASSDILTLMRRTGECKDGSSGRKT